MVIKEREARLSPRSLLKMQPRELHFETGVNHYSFKIILDFIKDIRTHNNEMALGLY